MLFFGQVVSPATAGLESKNGYFFKIWTVGQCCRFNAQTVSPIFADGFCRFDLLGPIVCRRCGGRG